MCRWTSGTRSLMSSLITSISVIKLSIVFVWYSGTIFSTSTLSNQKVDSSFFVTISNSPARRVDKKVISEAEREAHTSENGKYRQCSLIPGSIPLCDSHEQTQSTHCRGLVCTVQSICCPERYVADQSLFGRLKWKENKISALKPIQTASGWIYLHISWSNS